MDSPERPRPPGQLLIFPPLSTQFCEWALRERHLAIPSPTAFCFHSQPEGMKEGDSDRNPRVGPLKAAERRWDPSGGSRHLPAAPAQKAQILPPLPTSARDPWWQNSTRAGTLGAARQSCTGMEGRGEGPVPWHTAWRGHRRAMGRHAPSPTSQTLDIFHTPFLESHF